MRKNDSRVFEAATAVGGWNTDLQNGSLGEDAG